jgi:hypothetical protein
MATVLFTSNNYSSGTAKFTPSDSNFTLTDLGSIQFPYTFDPTQFGLPDHVIEGNFEFTTGGCVFNKIVTRPATTIAQTQATSATTLPTTTLATNATTLATLATNATVPATSATAATTLATNATTEATSATTAFDEFVYFEMANCNSPQEKQFVAKFYKAGTNKVTGVNIFNVDQDPGKQALTIGAESGWTIQSNGASGYPTIDGEGCFFALAAIDQQKYADDIAGGIPDFGGGVPASEGGL